MAYHGFSGGTFQAWRVQTNVAIVQLMVAIDNDCRLPYPRAPPPNQIKHLPILWPSYFELRCHNWLNFTDFLPSFRVLSSRQMK
jgi:hypothetical protein